MKHSMRIGYGGMAVLVAACALLAASCSKHLTGVDPSYTNPEGVRSNATWLLMWPVVPVVVQEYKDVAPLGPGPEDTYVGTVTYRRQEVTRDGKVEPQQDN